jgi:hypothetical protein
MVAGASRVEAVGVEGVEKEGGVECWAGDGVRCRAGGGGERVRNGR